ncbi:M16 family metallopeptidase [Sphingomonas colocasiae]|uniref:Insulinase family protein n=1 Tax=Sphingomonas colocasiae TaxID=1848973 RepID=A0ABS7PPI7_9SPHN|nr:insulinase family protein [Sphingomonas colocasiae]MBY8823241.1 insulinase family protein [Sphingomonas colocasiae]
MRTKIMPTIACGLLLAAGAERPVHAGDVKVGPDTVRLDPDVRFGRLANGFTYYIRRSLRPAKRIEMRLVVKAGTMQQDKDQVEYAHLVEHIVANHVAGDRGTIWDWVPSWGGRLGSDFTAQTLSDRTVFKLNIPAGRADLFSDALAIQRGWAQGAAPGAKDLGRERKAVLAEILRSNNHQARMLDQTLPGITPYYDRWDVRQKAIEQSDDAPALRFHRDWYRPDTQAIIIVGDIDPVAVEAQVRQVFGDMRTGARKRAREAKPAPVPVRDGFRLITDPEQKEVQLRWLGLRRRETVSDVAGLRRELLLKLVDNMYRQRHLRIEERDDPLLAQSGSDVSTVHFARRYPGKLAGVESIFVLFPEQIKEGIDAGLAIRRAVMADGFQQAELDKAREELSRELLAEASAPADRPPASPALAARLAEHFVTGLPVPAWPDHERLYRGLLSAITLADVNKAAREGLSLPNREMLLVAPSGLAAAMPSEAQIRSWIDEAARKPATPFTLRPSAAEMTTNIVLPDYAGTPIVTEFKETGLTRVVIPENGVTIILKPDRDLAKPDIRKGKVHILATRLIGAEEWRGDAYLNARQAGSLAYAGGVGGLTQFDLDALLKDRRIWSAPEIDEDRTQYMSGGPIEELNMIMQLAYGHFTEANRSEDAFRGRMKAVKAYHSTAAVKDPNAIFGDRMSSLVYRYAAERPERNAGNLDRIRYDEALKSYRHAMGNAAEFLFTVEGRFTPSDIIPTLTRYLSRLPSAGPDKLFSFKRPYQLRHDPIAETIYAGEGVNAMVGLVFAGPLAIRLEQISKVRALRSIMEARLLDRLREKEGGTYTVNFTADVSISAGEYDSRIYFECKAADVERLVAAAMDEVRKISAEGVTTAELASAAALEARHLQDMDKKFYYWADELTLRYVVNAGQDRAFEPLTYDPVTAADVQALARQLLVPEKLQRYVRLPESSRPK